jgi:hypothetical protein
MFYGNNIFVLTSGNGLVSEFSDREFVDHCRQDQRSCLPKYRQSEIQGSLHGH